MAGNEFLDKQGVGVLWERIKQLIYECCCKNITTYRLESDGNTITLIGSDGTRSSVAVISTASCGDEPVEPTIRVSVDCNMDYDTRVFTINGTVTVDEPITGATVLLRRQDYEDDYEILRAWENITLSGTTTYTATDQLSCPGDSVTADRYGDLLVFKNLEEEPIARGADTYHYECSY